MNKKVKISLLGLGSVAVAAAIAVGGFLAVYPMTPNVEIKSAQNRIENNGELLIASYNTAAPWGNLIKGTYTTRRAHLFAQQMNNTLPDSFGVQEINTFWVEHFKELLPQYAYYGVKRGGDGEEKTSEMSGIFYLKEKFNLLDSGTFWISNTPETESKFDGAACYRICSYAVLENKATGFKYIHMNTHLDHVGEKARQQGMKVVRRRISKDDKLYPGVPVILMGDFNAYPDSPFLSEIDGITDVTSHIPVTFHCYGRKEAFGKIDYIYTNMKAENVRILDDEREGVYLSDHYPIVGELQ